MRHAEAKGGGAVACMPAAVSAKIMSGSDGGERINFPRLYAFKTAVCVPIFTGDREVGHWALAVIYREQATVQSAKERPQYVRIGPLGEHDESYRLKTAWRRPRDWFGGAMIPWKARWTAVGTFFVLAGVVSILGVGLMLPAFVTVFRFNTLLVEELVVDEKDALHNEHSWRRFVWGAADRVRENHFAGPERVRYTKLHQFYVFAIQNMDKIVMRNTDEKKFPFIKQQGPYGYREYIEKYDVRFTNSGLDNTGSDLITFRSWSFYEPLPVDDTACAINDGRLDLTGALPNCRDDTFVYTFVNRQFLQYIQEHTSAGVMGKLGHRLFQDVKRTFTDADGPFLTNLKIWELSPVLEKVAMVRAVQKVPGALDDVVQYRSEYTPMLTIRGAPMLRPLSQTFPMTPKLPSVAFPVPFAATASAWVRQNKRNSGYLLAKIDPVDGECCWCLSMNGRDSENDFRFEFKDAAGRKRVEYAPWSIAQRFDRDDGSNPATAVRGLWHHVTLVVKQIPGDQLDAQFYVDGQAYRQASLFDKSELHDCANGEVYVGENPYGAGFISRKEFSGELSDVRFYSRALTGVEVNSIYQSPSSYQALTKAQRIYCGETQNSDVQPGVPKDTCPFGTALFIVEQAEKILPASVRPWLTTGQTTGLRLKAATEAVQTNWRALSSFQAHFLLDPPSELLGLLNTTDRTRILGAPGAPFVEGFHYWYNASEHYFAVNHGEGPEKDRINERAFDTLVDKMVEMDMDLSPDRSTLTPVSYAVAAGEAAGNATEVKRLVNLARVRGLLNFFFHPSRGWVNERATKQKVAYEWTTSPVNTISCEMHRDMKCEWEISPYVNFLGVTELPLFSYTGDDSPTPPSPKRKQLIISVNVARVLIDPAYKYTDLGMGRGLSASLLNSHTLPRVWGLAYHYCDAWRHSRDMSCLGMKKAIEMGKDILPPYLAGVDLIQQTTYQNNMWAKYKYELQTCAIADFVVRNFVEKNAWYQVQLAAIINRDFWDVWNAQKGLMSPAKLREMGYMQWATGFYTQRRFGVASLANLADSGNVESTGTRGVPVAPVLHARVEFLSITDLEEDREPLELGGIAVSDGFPEATNASAVDLGASIELLDALADPDSYTRTDPRDTLCAQLLRGAAGLMIGNGIDMSNLPQSDLFKRTANTWQEELKMAPAGGWRVDADAHGYRVFKDSEMRMAQWQPAVAQHQRTFFALDVSVSATENVWEDPLGDNLEDGYSYPTASLKALLSPVMDGKAFDKNDTARIQAADSARYNAEVLCNSTGLCRPAVTAAGTPPDNAFLMSLLLSLPGCELSLPAATAFDRCSYWASVDHGAKRLLPNNVGDCPETWAFRNLLRLNPACDITAHNVSVDYQLGSSANRSLAYALTPDVDIPGGAAARVAFKTPLAIPAGGTATVELVTTADFERAKQLFFRVAAAYDDANHKTRMALAPHLMQLVALNPALPLTAEEEAALAASPLPQLDAAVVDRVLAVKRAYPTDVPQVTGVVEGDPTDPSGFATIVRYSVFVPVFNPVRPNKRRATVLAGMIQSMVYNGFFLKRRHFCGGSPKTCDYRVGGMFTTQTVRNYLFEGYTDPVFSEMARDNFERHGFRYTCVGAQRLRTLWDCSAAYEIDCSDHGYELSVADVQTVTTRADNFLTIIDGNFTLAFGGHATKALKFSASDEDMKEALEALPDIGTVLVSRSNRRAATSASLLQTQHGDLGFTWSVTFVTEKGDLPLLTSPSSNFSALRQQPAVWTGTGPQVWVRKVHKGLHPGAAFDAVTVYDRVNARQNGEWYRRAISVPDVSNTSWTCTPPCRAVHDARPLIQLANPAFIARDMWFGDLWHGKLWHNEAFHKDQDCARTNAELKTIYYHYDKRYATCEHTTRTGRLDLATLGDITRFYGNESMAWWPNSTSALVHGRGVPAQFKPFLFWAFLSGNIDGHPGPIAFFDRESNMGVRFVKVSEKDNNEPVNLFSYSPKRKAGLMDTHNMTEDVTIDISRYCRDHDSWHRVRKSGEPQGMLNLRPFTNSDLMIGPPHHQSIQQPWLPPGERAGRGVRKIIVLRFGVQ
eukprot:g6.t1